MLNCRRCDAPETLEAPFIEGICFDCLRKETMSTHPAERTRVFLAGLDRARLARPDVDESDVDSEEPAVQPVRRARHWLPKLHVRDFFWLTLLIAVGFKSYRDQRDSAVARKELELQTARTHELSVQRNLVQVALEDARLHLKVSRIWQTSHEADQRAWQQAQREWQQARQAMQLELDRAGASAAAQREVGLRQEISRLGIRLVEYNSGKINLSIPGRSSDWTFHESERLAKYYPTD